MMSAAYVLECRTENSDCQIPQIQFSLTRVNRFDKDLSIIDCFCVFSHCPWPSVNVEEMTTQASYAEHLYAMLW